MKRHKNIRFLILVALSSQLLASSCTSIDLYEKTATIPGHSWKSSFKPSFTFTIKDSTSPYELFLIFRHSEKYNYTNIYLNLTIKTPGSDSTKTIRVDLPLANAEGWIGASGMDDIYEHRISLNQQLVNNDFSMKNLGDYTFTLEQIMREDPLQHVYDAGLRVEKKKN